MSSAFKKDKKLLRRHFQKMRKDFFDLKDPKHLATEILIQLKPLFVEASEPFAGYLSYGSETSLDGLLDNSQHKHDVVYPRVDGQNLIFYRPSSQEFTLNEWGIREPNPQNSEELDVEKCGMALVPGVAFDKRGVRLGHGKGFYDRALHNYKGLKVGICYSVQVSEEDLPRDSHDISMDYIVTEKFIMKPIYKEKSH